MTVKRPRARLPAELILEKETCVGQMDFLYKNTINELPKYDKILLKI